MRAKATRLQQAAYDAQLAAALPGSDLGRALLGRDGETVAIARCRLYIHTVQQMDWFIAAFYGRSSAVVVVGGRGGSHADAAQWRIKIGTNDRGGVRQCEHSCLHELAHIVTADLGPGWVPREPDQSEASTRGHHHAWRANLVFIVHMMLGKPAARRLRQEFNEWQLPTR